MATSSAAFSLIDALFAQATTALAGSAKVYDGYGLSNDPNQVSVMIGLSDPESDSPAVSVEADQDWAHANTTDRDEIGDVLCAAYSWNGDGNPKTARDAVKATLDAIAGLIETDFRLGIPEMLFTQFRLTSLDQDQDKKGAWALALFRVHFLARL